MNHIGQLLCLFAMMMTSCLDAMGQDTMQVVRDKVQVTFTRPAIITDDKWDLVKEVDRKKILYHISFKYDIGADIINRYAANFFFNDTVSATLKDAFKKFREAPDVHELTDDSESFNEKHTFLLEIKTERSGAYQCYNIAKMVQEKTESGVNSNIVQHNIIYDVKNERLFTPEDIFVPSYADSIRQVAQGKPVEMIMNDEQFMWSYKGENFNNVVTKLSFYKNESLFKESFLSQIDWENIKNSKVFDVVEKMPEFSGGQKALFDFLSKNIKYPKIAEENGFQGRVICSFIVEPDGSITNVRVVKSVAPWLDHEAVRVLQTMPKWIPGKQNGKPIRVKYTVPVTFSLNNLKR